MPRSVAGLPMNVSGRVREIYEERPYPASMGLSSARRWWLLAPMEWIRSVWLPRRPSPRRILVAGCGTGLEAFALRRRFPDAEIVAVDFSSRSIAAARRSSQGFRSSRPIRFVVADLASRQFASLAGTGFDFITCHGVLSYISRPERALRNLARCLELDGALYLGVNGAGHSSVGGRQFLSGVGFDVTEFHEGRKLRRVLRVHDAIIDVSATALAKRKAGYLAGDLFGPLIHNLPLRDWVRICREAGLYFLGCYGKLRPLRRALNDDFHPILMPRSRAEVCELVDMLVPAGFHRLLLTRRPPAELPWDEPEKLLDWRPAITELYRHRWPRRRGSWHTLRSLKLKSPSTNTLMELRLPEWELEVLRRSDGERSLREILDGVPIRPSLRSLCLRVYQLYLAFLINLLPPVSADRVAPAAHRGRMAKSSRMRVSK